MKKKSHEWQISEATSPEDGQSSEENGQSARRRRRGSSGHYNQAMQRAVSEHATNRVSQQMSRSGTGCHFCQRTAGRQGCNSHRHGGNVKNKPKRKQRKHDVASFCHDLVLRPQFGINNVNAGIHPALLQAAAGDAMLWGCFLVALWTPK